MLNEEKSPRFSRLGFLLLAYPGDLPVDGPVDSRCSKSDVAKRCFFPIKGGKQKRAFTTTQRTYIPDTGSLYVNIKRKGKA